MTLREKLQSIIDYANMTTGKNDTTITDAIISLSGSEKIKNTQKRTITEKIQSLIDFINSITGKQDTTLTECIKSLVEYFLENAVKGGLYDENNVLVASWDELVNVHGLNIAKDYDKTTVFSDSASAYNVFSKQELSAGRKLVIDKSVTYIGSHAFRECPIVEEFIFTDEIVDTGTNVFYKNEFVKKVKLSNSMMVIRDSLFGMSGIEVADIPNGVKKIEQNAYRSCKSLKILNMSDSVEEICYASIAYCDILDTIVYSKNLKKMGDYACAYNPVLVNCDISKTKIEEMGQGAYYESAGFATMIFPSTVKKVGKFLFGSNKDGGVNTPKTLDMSACDFAEVEDTTGMFQYRVALGEKEAVKYPKNFLLSPFTFNHNSRYYALNNGIFNIPSDWRLLLDKKGHYFYDTANVMLKGFSVEEGNTHFADVNGALYTKDLSSLLCVPPQFNVERYEMAEGVTFLIDMCFSRNTIIKTVVIPNSLRIFEGDMEVDYVDDVSNILSDATYIYTAISAYEAKADNTNYMSHEGCIYSKDGTKFFAIPYKYDGVCRIKDCCTTITAEAFNDNGKPAVISELTEIRIPASVVNITPWNLKKMNGLTHVTKVIDDMNPAFEVVDNKIVERTTPLPEQKVTVAHRQEPTYTTNDDGTINPTFYGKISLPDGCVLEDVVDWGSVYTTKLTDFIIDGDLNPALKPNFGVGNIPQNGEIFYTKKNMPKGYFIRVIFFAHVNKKDGTVYCAYSEEKRIDNPA